MPLPEPDIQDLQLRTNLEDLDKRLLGSVSERVFKLALDSLTTALTEPTGTVKAFAASTAPTGYLVCDGSAVSRTTYADLFAVIGTSYGVGNGSTTFNLPDLRGRAPVGVGTHADVNALNKNDGVTVASRTPKHVLTTAEIPSHTHPMNMTQGLNVAGGGGGSSGYLWHNSGPVSTGSNSGGGGAHDHGFMTLNFIIKT